MIMPKKVFDNLIPSVKKEVMKLENKITKLDKDQEENWKQLDIRDQIALSK
jgi:hypothetical protein